MGVTGRRKRERYISKIKNPESNLKGFAGSWRLVGFGQERCPILWVGVKRKEKPGKIYPGVF